MAVPPSSKPVTQHRSYPSKLRIGDHVRVADANQILQTLDANGRCDGLPFMPQMATYCGQRMLVTRWVNNVCVQQADGMHFGNLPGAVLLNTERCDGVAQGGCQMACPLIWKTDWLLPEASQKSNRTIHKFDPELDSKVLADTASDSDSFQTLVNLANRTTNDSADSPGCVSCQATTLFQIAPPRPKSDIAQYLEERNLNRVSAASIASSFCGGMIARIRGQQNGLVGTLKNTPRSDLNLQPGDIARVRTKEEIVHTLDRDGKNRGLWFDPVMLRYCGQQLAVTKRISRIVDETSGRLLELRTPSIVLEDLHCQPSDRRFCSRLLHLFWREIWLERVAG